MVYDSVYEANNYLRGTARKQHFWDWFSGSKLQEGVTGTNSYSTAFPNATGWSSRGSQVSITGGVVNTNFGATDDNSAVLRSLGYDITGDFELRIKHRFISHTSSTSGMIALADSTNPVYNPTTAGSNSVMIGINSDQGGAHSFAFYSVENGVFTNHGDPPISTGKTGTVSNATDYWLKMTKVGNLVTINVYSDSSYSSLVTSCYGSVSSSFPSTLNSIQIGMAWTMSGRGANWTDTDLSLTSDVVGGTRWNVTNNNASTSGMSDEVDGGYYITDINSYDSTVAMFNNTGRVFAPRASVFIYQAKLSNAGASNASGGGLYNNDAGSEMVSYSGYQWEQSANVNYFMSSDGTTRSWLTQAGISAGYHIYSAESKSSGIDGSIDGIFVTTKTTNLPPTSGTGSKLQAGFWHKGASETFNINYFEAYNT